MRHFKDGEELWLEPFRAKAFPVLRDLMVDRSSFDRIVAAGGFVSVNTGSAPDGNAIPIEKKCSDMAMDAAACIGCGACVAACPNASASLFVSAKISHLGAAAAGPARARPARSPHGGPDDRKKGSATAQTPANARLSAPRASRLENIARMNRDYIGASFTHREESSAGGGA